jgi:S-adenosylmethionine:tRNA ribosyltransferase-isomerase
MRRSNFDYTLPQELIAQTPNPTRTSSRLLVVAEQSLEHLCFADLPQLLHPGDLLVLNDTRVLKARLFAVKDSGGDAGVLVERIVSDDEAVCQVRVSKPLKSGRTLQCAGEQIEVVKREGQFYRLKFPRSVGPFLESHGHVPLPPYINRPANGADGARYQTVFAREPGAVAAPTAGLHFDEAMLADLRAMGVEIAFVTLHVGAGTFQPVRVEDLATHRMHSERYALNEGTVSTIERCRQRGGRVVAVGTTVVRVLESRVLESVVSNNGEVRAGEGETDLFITPGFEFRVVDALITNFHLPQSTLLMLVAAFAGYERTMSAYRGAVDDGYRFFSYGDAMFCERSLDV